MMRRTLGMILVATVLPACHASSPPEPVSTVVIASRDIVAGQVLTTAMLSTTSIPTRYAQPKSVSDPAMVAGETTPDTIFAGEQILTTKLLSPQNLSAKTPRGFRALTLPVVPGQFAGTATDYVDVIGIFDLGDATKSDPRAVTLFQNVYVLETGQPNPVYGTPTSITLMVNPEEAEKLLGAAVSGRLYFTVRSKLEGNTQWALEQIDIHKAIGIPINPYRSPPKRPFYDGYRNIGD